MCPGLTGPRRSCAQRRARRRSPASAPDSTKPQRNPSAPGLGVGGQQERQGGIPWSNCYGDVSFNGRTAPRFRPRRGFPAIGLTLLLDKDRVIDRATKVIPDLVVIAAGPIPQRKVPRNRDLLCGVPVLKQRPQIYYQTSEFMVVPVVELNAEPFEDGRRIIRDSSSFGGEIRDV